MNRSISEIGLVEDYYSARERFLAVCDARSLKVASYRHPLQGPDGNPIFTDAVRIGRRDANKVLLVNSGIHGVEGYAGSHAQVDIVRTFDTVRLSADTAIVLIHLINPWGTAWRRRQNEDNIDLNRHFIDRSQASPANEPHKRLISEGFLDALSAPSPTAALQQIDDFRELYGEDLYAQAVFQGQYDCPGGLGFGGVAPSWSQQTLEAALNDLLSNPESLALIDLHTGLGPFGTGTLICTEVPDSDQIAVLREWYDTHFVALLVDQEGLPYKLQGDLANGVRRILPSTRVLPISLEFGTYDARRFAELMVRDAWAETKGNPQYPEVEAIRCDLMHFFYPAHASGERWLHPEPSRLQRWLSPGFRHFDWALARSCRWGRAG